MEARKVLIMQGLPGSGKSTYLKALTNGVIASADNFFTQGGVYNFDPAKLPEAHARCLRGYARAVQELAGSAVTIAVDNTNTTVAEVAPYYALAQAYGHEVEILYFPCTPELAAQRNTHGVPLSSCQAMAARLEKFAEQMPPWWRRRTIES